MNLQLKEILSKLDSEDSIVVEVLKPRGISDIRIVLSPEDFSESVSGNNEEVEELKAKVKELQKRLDESVSKSKYELTKESMLSAAAEVTYWSAECTNLFIVNQRLSELCKGYRDFYFATLFNEDGATENADKYLTLTASLSAVNKRLLDRVKELEDRIREMTK